MACSDINAKISELEADRAWLVRFGKNAFRKTSFRLITLEHPRHNPSPFALSVRFTTD